MLVLSFGVSFIPFFLFNTVIAPILCFTEFSKRSSNYFLKMITFAKELFQTPLCYDSYVSCAILFA
jgi:hypothetical protein